MAIPKTVFHPTLRHLKWRAGGCCLAIILAMVVICGALISLLTYFIQSADAQEAVAPPRQVMLLIDNSQSMYDQGLPGSDPQFLRIEAARLFITYLGVDSSEYVVQLGVIFFGTEAKLTIPLTVLNDTRRRDEIFSLIANPDSQGWTNQLAALSLAEETFNQSSAPNATRAVVLLTDGQPEWSQTPTAQEKAMVIAQLEEIAGQFADTDIPLFIVLLDNPNREPNAETETIYVPLWQKMADMTPQGNFFRADDSDDLLNIYHQIALSLTGRQTAGVIVQTNVQRDTAESIAVESGLAQVTFVIHKSNPDLQVSIIGPDDRQIKAGTPGIQQASQAQRPEEIWVIENPPPGKWQIRLNGQGEVTVWKDFLPATATPTNTPTATATSTPTPTITPTFTPTTRPPIPTNTAIPTATPTPETITTQNTIKASAEQQNPIVTLLKRLGAAVAFLAGSGGGWYFFRQQAKIQTPQLDGILRHLSSSPSIDSHIPSYIDLGAMASHSVILGPESIPPLPHTTEAVTPTIRITAQTGPGEDVSIMLHVEAPKTGTIQVNGIPVINHSILKDGDIIDLGAHRFRYENIHQRRYV